MMMAEIRDSAASIRSRLPEHLRDKLVPEACLEEVHGVTMGDWACPSCGTVYEAHHYPSPWCPNPECRRPLPRRCEEPGCDNLVEPVQYEDGWHGPVTPCQDCVAGKSKNRRRDTVRATFPEKELRDLRANGYHSHDHRKPLDAALRRWVDSRCGADSHRPWLIAWGGTGSGKTMAFIYHASAAYSARCLVQSIAYTTEEELLRAASLEWARDERGGQKHPEARELLQRCESVELLVLDELGAEPKLTDGGRKALIRLLKRRADAEMPTLIAMNRAISCALCGKQKPMEGPPREACYCGGEYRTLSWLDVRVDSRLDQIAEVVECAGVDLRRGQG